MALPGSLLLPTAGLGGEGQEGERGGLAGWLGSCFLHEPPQYPVPPLTGVPAQGTGLRMHLPYQSLPELYNLWL